MLSYISSLLFNKKTPTIETSSSVTDSHKQIIHLPKIEDQKNIPVFKKGLPIQDNHKPGVNTRNRIF